ncbi:hypothetical protein ABTO49_21170, partial [Acinetobacter baumannii]
STCSIQTNAGDDVTGVVRVKVAGADGLTKFNSALIAISGTYRDYPGEDALQAIMDKISHIAVVQGWPFRIPVPDPAPFYQSQIDIAG